MRIVEEHACFGGVQRVYEHDSSTLGCEMRVGIYLPPGFESLNCPVLYFLSGLTCTEQNALTKAGAQQAAAEHGFILVMPDTSPRGVDVADDDAWDLGQGAGFYLTATRAPWSTHYRMDQYVVVELPQILRAFTQSTQRGVFGHSMGGMGAITLALRHPTHFGSVSAFAPILSPSQVPWGEKAFTAYLGNHRATWRGWDPTDLMRESVTQIPLRIDQGSADPFLQTQLSAGPFLEAARSAGFGVDYRMQEGYDHSYYFVASFMAQHVAFHRAALRQ